MPRNYDIAELKRLDVAHHLPAQQDYQLARSYGQSDDLTRRYAMSLSMAGKANEADAMLLPLLQRNDPEAWRARSMMLAARGNIRKRCRLPRASSRPMLHAGWRAFSAKCHG